MSPSEKPASSAGAPQGTGDGSSHHCAADETVHYRPNGFDIHGYQIQREIGRGAMGVVYEAIQLSVDRRVAIKTITGSGDASSRERFRLEASTIAHLQHPNIVQLFDYGEAEGQPYVSLELVTGQALDKLLSESGTPTPREAASWLETLALAIHVAHEAGIIHRDLKPANILTTPNGTLKISDFGLAKRMDNDSSATRAGDILGTPHYMAPEQASGRIQEIGPHTDVYALGAILYELLTGQRPLSGETVLDTLQLVRSRDPVTVRSRNPKVSVDLETICMKCLRKEPGRRYPTALALAQDLRRFLDGEPVQARPISLGEKLIRWGRRSPYAVSMGALMLVMGVAGTLLLMVANQKVDAERQLVDETRHQAQAEAARLSSRGALALATPLGLRAVSIPSDNPLTAAKVELGKQLFFDKRLSLDDSVSCADCHNPALGWSNAKPVSPGIGGQQGTRNSPSIVNAAHSRVFFWDGRAENFEEQALGPLLNPVEMGIPSREFLVQKVSKIPGYVTQFDSIFEDGLTAINISRALASFERTILAGNTPFDRYQAGDKAALSEAALRGKELFFNKAHCSACHTGPFLTDDGFHNIGISTGRTPKDVGREALSNLQGDRGAFKTPSLREIARTAPYMHDGSLATLEEVIEHYNKGGDGNPHLDEAIFPLKLTDQEQRDLVLFLKDGLRTADYPFVEAPRLP